MANWNPWHGCHKISPGCANCYVYRTDETHGKDGAAVYKTANFDLPVKKDRKGEYKIPEGELVWTCFTSDFLLEEADEWRRDAWRMIRERSDLSFLFVTKRILRFSECIPEDWGDGYDNVEICCTAENQEMADLRLPVFLKAPIKRKSIICEPLLSKIDLSRYLDKNIISGVSVGGESGPAARPCDYDWVLDILMQCVAKGVAFKFNQTGANFIKNGKAYSIPRKFQHSQARKAHIDYSP